MARVLILLISAFLVLLSAGCQTPATAGDLQVEQVFDVPNFKKDAIYDQVKIWIAENFRSARQVIEHDDKASGTLIGNGTTPYSPDGYNKKVQFTMRVDVKDNRFKLNFINLLIVWPAYSNSVLGVHTPAGEAPVQYKEEIDVIRPKLLQYGTDIQNHITQSKSKADW